MKLTAEQLGDIFEEVFTYLLQGNYDFTVQVGNVVIKCTKEGAANLAAPNRNCDLYATAEEARQAWLDDAGNWDAFGSPRLELHEWLFAPVTKQEGDDK